MNRAIVASAGLLRRRRCLHLDQRKHAAMTGCLGLCLLVLGNGDIKAAAPPDVDAIAERADCGNALRMKASCNFGDRAIGVFVEGKHDDIQRSAVGGNGVSALLVGGREPSAQQQHHEGAGDTKQESDIADDGVDYFTPFVRGMWIGLAVLFIFRVIGVHEW